MDLSRMTDYEKKLKQHRERDSHHDVLVIIQTKGVCSGGEIGTGDAGRRSERSEYQEKRGKKYKMNAEHHTR